MRCSSYQQELVQYRELGIPVHIDGSFCDISDPAHTSILLEDNNYMRDFEEAFGEIVSIRYDRI